MPSVRTTLAEKRSLTGWTQVRLARASGVSRAEISAIETGRLVPSTAVALALARALGVAVETLFALDLPAHALAWAAPADPARVWRGEVGGRQLLYPAEATAAGVLPHDGVLAGGRLQGRGEAPPPERTLVVAGCDPLVGLLVQEVAQHTSIRVVPLLRSSRDALDLLGRGLVHVAGLHLSDARGRPAHRQAVERLGDGYRLLHLLQWDAGIAVRPERRAKSVDALLAPRVRWVNREPGSGARECLDRLLDRRPRPPGYARVVHDHRAVAATVTSGWADAGICVRPVAVEASLDFLSVQRETYELCYAPWLEDDPRLDALLAAVRSPAYRARLADVPGCVARETGTLHTVAGR